MQEELEESEQDISLPVGRDSGTEQIRRIADDKINHRWQETKDTIGIALVINNDFIWTPINSGRHHTN